MVNVTNANWVNSLVSLLSIELEFEKISSIKPININIPEPKKIDRKYGSEIP